MSDDAPWAYVKSLKAYEEKPQASSTSPVEAPPPKTQESSSSSAPSTSLASGFINNDINLMRNADLFIGAGMTSYTAREMMDPNDPRTQIANQTASNIVNDIMDALKYYMKIEHDDPIVRTMISLKKMIATRYAFHPSKPYIRMDMRYRLGAEPGKPGGVKRTRKDKMKAFKVGEDGEIEVDPGTVLSDNADKLLKRVEEDSESEEEVEDDNFPSAEESIAMIERRSRKIADIKHIARQNINVWVYNKMNTRSFLTYVGGSIGFDTLNSLCRVDIPESILNIYLEKTREKFEKSPFDGLEKLGLYSMEQVDTFIKTLSPTGGVHENAILEYLRKDDEDPIRCFKELVISTLLTTVTSAWNFLEPYLLKLKEVNPMAPGLLVNRPYWDRKTGIPDMRMMIRPLPLGTDKHAQVEFGNLVRIFQQDVKNFNLAKNDTRFESSERNKKTDDIIRTLFLRLEHIGFTGITGLLHI